MTKGGPPWDLAVSKYARELQSDDDKEVSERLSRVNVPASPGKRGRERPAL
jgi:hypothetical protein